MRTLEQRRRYSASAAKVWQQRAAALSNAHPLKIARAERNLTQKELAGLAGTTRQSISGIENNGECSAYLRNRISKAIARPESDLFA